VVLSDTVNTFENKIDKFWQDQPIIYEYDFKAEIQETGSRSLY